MNIMTPVPPELEALMPNPWQPATRAYPALFTADQVRQAMLDATERAAKLAADLAYDAAIKYADGREVDFEQEIAAAIRGDGGGA